jgi:hypothetical protein
VFVLERKTKMAAGLKVSKEVAGIRSLSRKKKKHLNIGDDCCFRFRLLENIQPLL